MHKAKNHIRKGQSFPGLCGRVWIDGERGTFLSYGRVVLLERIREFGSITKAAKSMEMSYRHAWQLVNSMNGESRDPFVVATTGGKGGGGTCLTEAGEKAVSLFWEFHEDFQDFLKHEGKKMGKFLLKIKRTE